LRSEQRPPLSQAEVETLILKLTDALADGTDDYRELCDKVATAEMNYKHSFHSAIVTLAHGSKLTADLRKSTAWLRSEVEERAYTTLAASKESGREYLRTLTTRIEALRTISANVRGQT